MCFDNHLPTVLLLTLPGSRRPASPLLQPTFEVLAVAVNSGLAAYPTAYRRIWSGAGGAIWRAVPPAGYVAAGDLFSLDDGREPELSAMVCLHGTRVWMQFCP